MPAQPLNLGVNKDFGEFLVKAESITGIDAAALAALVDAEAAKGSDGKWNPKSFNAGSGAAGMTQFLAGTWLDHARRKGTLLNQVAKEKGFVTALDAVAGGREVDLLALRFDPQLSIVSAAEYGALNLRTLVNAGLVKADIGDDEKARFMYLAHHEGAGGARAIILGQNSNDFGKFVGQVGVDRATALTAAAGGDVALAYRRWLEDYIREHIQPGRFRTGAPGPVPLEVHPKSIAKFGADSLPLAMLPSQTDLVLDLQGRLAQLGYLDPPADGKWGQVSSWALAAFCTRNGLSLADGFTRKIADALLEPPKPLPDVRPGGTWLDKVVAYMNSKGYWICRHPGAVNIVYVEGLNKDGTTNDNRPNVFNDVRLVFTIDDAGRPILGDRCWDATTEPGLFWTMNPMVPTGAARIAFGQYKAWRVGIHKDHEALVQVDKITVHRDLNKDFLRLNDKTEEGLFAINQHWGYDAAKDDVGNTSAGCLVGRSRNEHRTFMAQVKTDPRFNANPSYTFLTAVLPGAEVMA